LDEIGPCMFRTMEHQQRVTDTWRSSQPVS
jgi:hypothetical protein